jgi:hypothetical protein
MSDYRPKVDSPLRQLAEEKLHSFVAPTQPMVESGLPTVPGVMHGVDQLKMPSEYRVCPAKSVAFHSSDVGFVTELAPSSAQFAMALPD